MEKIKKKVIQSAVSGAVAQALTTFEITAPSKKTRRVIDKATKDISGEVRKELKKRAKKSEEVAKEPIKSTLKKLKTAKSA